MHKLVMVITIVIRGSGDKFIEEYRAFGIPITMLSLGRGTASDEMLSLLGLGETEKEILFSLTTGKRAGLLLRRLDVLAKRRAGNNVAFSVPVDSIGALALSKYFTGNSEGEEIHTVTSEHEEGKIPMDQTSRYSLIVVVTNKGYVDQVMEAARNARATGGTVIHARGAGSGEAEKFFGVSIHSEKEMIFIVVKGENKQGVMKAIMEEAGIHTKARSMIFTVPVDNIAGLNLDLSDE